MSTSDLAQGIIQTNASTNLVSQWVQQYLIDCRARQLVHGTISFYRKKLNQFVRYYNEFGVTTIDQINANLIRGFLLNLEETGHNQGGINGHYRVIKSWLFWYELEAEPDNWKNPVKKVHAPKTVQDLIEPVTPEQVTAILDTFDSTELGIRNRTIILVLFDTGLRSNELLTVQFENVDFFSGSMNVIGKGN